MHYVTQVWCGHSIDASCLASHYAAPCRHRCTAAMTTRTVVTTSFPCPAPFESSGEGVGEEKVDTEELMSGVVPLSAGVV